MTQPHPRWKILAAFAAVYIIWGSTYLGIRFAVETIPSFLMISMRFFSAGILLYGWARMRGAPKPTPVHWRSAAAVGFLLILVWNGSVSWAEQVLPSGIAALCASVTPLGFVIAEWWQTRTRPHGGVIIGLMLGTIGMIVLIDPVQLVGERQVNFIGAAAILFGSIGWVGGSLYSRKADLPSSQLLATGIQMLAGAAFALLAGAFLGEFSRFHLASVSLTSILAVAYLMSFGSIIAFTSYVWLMRVSTPSLVATHAYINPVVAVFLGWLLANEPINARILIASAVIIAGVATITTVKARKGQAKKEQ